MQCDGLQVAKVNLRADTFILLSDTYFLDVERDYVMLDQYVTSRAVFTT
jgi:hypothetical protein